MRPPSSIVLLTALAISGWACGGPGTVSGRTVADEVSATTATPEADGEEPIDASVCSGETGSAEVLVGQLNRDTTSFEVAAGLPVILKRTPGNPVVAVRLYIDGGSRDLTEDNAGINQLALEVATVGGTESFSKAELSSGLQSMGSSIGASTDLDYSVIAMSSLGIFLEETWALFREVLHRPAFPDAEVDLAKERQIQGIRMRVEDPDTRVIDAARAVLFAGHPYANRPQGTVESVGSLTRETIASRYEQLLDPSRMLLVVVGDIGREDLEALIGDTFDAFSPRGDRPDPPAPLAVAEPTFVVEAAPLPTNYIIGIAPAPSPPHEDYPALMLAHQHLSDRLFEEVRTVRNLSYAVSAGISSRLANYCYLYVTAVDPAATLPVMWAEVDRIRTTPLTDEEVEQLVAGYVTTFYQGIDSNAAIASELGWWELFGGGRDQADTYIARLEAVTPADIQRVSQQYLLDYQFAVVGNPAAVSADLFTAFDF